MCDKVGAESGINFPRSKIIYPKREIHDSYGGRRILSVVQRAISRRWFEPIDSILWMVLFSRNVPARRGATTVHRPREDTRCWYTVESREIRPSGSTRRFASNRPWPGIIARNYTFRVPATSIPTYRFMLSRGPCVTPATSSATVRHSYVTALSFERTLQSDTIRHVTRYGPREKRLVENWSVLLSPRGARSLSEILICQWDHWTSAFAAWRTRLISLWHSLSVFEHKM